MLRWEGNDDDLLMGNDIDEDMEDEDLPSEIDDDEGSQITLSWTMIMLATKRTTAMAHDVLSLVDGFGQ